MYWIAWLHFSEEELLLYPRVSVRVHKTSIFATIYYGSYFDKCYYTAYRVRVRDDKKTFALTVSWKNDTRHYMIEKKDKYHILGGPKFDCVMMVRNIGSERNFHFIHYIWKELCVLYPRAFGSNVCVLKYLPL